VNEAGPANRFWRGLRRSNEWKRNARILPFDDGAIDFAYSWGVLPWPITKREARAIFAPHASTLSLRVLGTDIDHILNSEIAPGVGRFLARVRKSLARCFGWSLWISGRK
jgi:hypothetical protein